MKHNLLRSLESSLGQALPIILIIYSLGAMFVGHVSFKQSTLVQGFWRFWFWQIIGHVVAASGVLAYTWTIKLWGMHMAYAIHAGVGFVIIQVLGAWLLFKEKITAGQWVGTALITAGILLIAFTRQGN